MSNWSNADKNEIARQSDLTSKPLRDNFNNIQTAINDNQTQISALSTAASGAEVSGARPYHTDLKQRLDSINNGQHPYIKSGGNVNQSNPVAMTVTVVMGEANVNGVDCKWINQTSGTITAPSTNNRYDVVVIDTTNSISIVTGSESTTPVFPILSSNQMALGYILLTPSHTTITNSDLTDARGMGAYYFDSGRNVYAWKIQDALDDASAGNIYIGAGTYYEDLTFPNDKTITFDSGAVLYTSAGALIDYSAIDLSAKTDTTIKHKSGVVSSGYEVAGELRIESFKNLAGTDNGNFQVVPSSGEFETGRTINGDILYGRRFTGALPTAVARSGLYSYIWTELIVSDSSLNLYGAEGIIYGDLATEGGAKHVPVGATIHDCPETNDTTTAGIYRSDDNDIDLVVSSTTSSTSTFNTKNYDVIIYYTK
jgi:hypothetical protein